MMNEICSNLKIKTLLNSRSSLVSETFLLGKKRKLAFTLFTMNNVEHQAYLGRVTNKYNSLIFGTVSSIFVGLLVCDDGEIIHLALDALASQAITLQQNLDLAARVYGHLALLGVPPLAYASDSDSVNDIQFHPAYPQLTNLLRINCFKHTIVKLLH
jgi:hypothetical protein